MLLSELFSRAGVVPESISGDAEITTLVMDSRKATPGCCFVCMPSESGDSHRFLSAAKEAGAVAAIVHSREGMETAVELGLAAAFVEPSLPLAPMNSGERGLGGEGGPETPEQRIRRTTGGFSEAMWRLAKVAFGDPSTKLKVIGVTGTNGKTTTAWLIRDMLNLLGIPCAYIGTLGFGLPLSANDSCRGEGARGWGEELRPLANTTPFSIELNAMLAECVERGCQAVAMEVSSHALAERRVDGIDFDVAVFTNLSQDHLDYHGSMEAYEAAKWRLFSDLVSPSPGDEGGGGGGWGEGVSATVQWAVLNADDPAQSFRAFHGDRWERWWSLKDEADDVYADVRKVELAHLSLTVRDDGPDVSVEAPVGGAYNVPNLVAGLTVLICMGFPLGQAASVCPNLRPVPGRFEPVHNDSGIGIIVDYAHTPDALEKLLATVRPLTKGNVITVFGCGGDRDKSKRTLMARAAQEGSDVVVVTSDNPRTEDPQAIIEDVTMGLDRSDLSDSSNVHIEPDRPAAVALAIKLAQPGDTVVVAGKGHEDYQIIGREKIHMDDRELAREGLRLRSG